MTPTVSIITPVHQGMPLLAQTAATVLAQTLSDWEWLIVVDDDHMPGYRALPGLDDPRIRWLATASPGAGPSAARNIGLDAARGEFVTHLDADDLMHEDRLQRLVPLAREHGMATDLHEVFLDEGGQVIGHCLPRSVPRLVGLEAVLALNLPFFPLYRRAIGQRWREELHFAEDVLFNLGLLAHNRVMALCHESLLRYRVHAVSASSAMPQGYLAARDAYARIQQALQSGEFAGDDAQWNQTLQAMFRRKAEFNEAFWQSYCAGGSSSFAQFAALRATS